MRFCFIGFLVGLCALTAMDAHAGRKPKAGPEDPRIKTVVYDARDVVTVVGHYGFSTVIEFAPDERIETISLGDSEGWQAVPNKAGNKLYLKPMERNANTNLSLETDRRSYIFELIARNTSSTHDPRLNFKIKFVYPQDEAVVRERRDLENARLASTVVGSGSSVPPDRWNFDYTFSGSRANKPRRIFDDGRFTYFEFSRNGSIPAIFWVDGRRNESLVNYTVRGRYIVVERTAAQFTLRNGDNVTCIFNESYRHAGDEPPVTSRQARAREGKK